MKYYSKPSILVSWNLNVYIFLLQHIQVDENNFDNIMDRMVTTHYTNSIHTI